MKLDLLANTLADLASRGALVTYGDLARALALPNPGSIARLADGLERLMAEDADAGRPFRAALCRAKTGDLPALGFFEAAMRLGRFNGADPVGFVSAERAALFKTATLR